MASLFSENILPGEYGKIFETNAKHDDDIAHIKDLLLQLDGIEKIKINKEKYPVEFHIYTNKIVNNKVLQDEIKRTGFHLIDKGII